MSDEDEFKWDDDEAVVIKSIQATAVYRNSFGHVVIRQERAAYGRTILTSSFRKQSFATSLRH